MPTRRLLAVLTAVALVACSAADGPGTSPDTGNDPEVETPTDPGTGTPGDPDTGAPGDSVVVVPEVPEDSIPSLLTTARLAVCAATPLDSASKVIGRNGGKIKIGKNQLQIGRDALSEDVRITFVTGGDSLAAVRIEPANVTFAAEGKVKLKLDYSHCPDARGSGNAKRVVRLDDANAIVAAPESVDDETTQGTEGTLPQLGRYGIAY
jgi:hypothetical protein